MYTLNFHLGLLTVLINLDSNRGSSLSSKTPSDSISQLAIVKPNGLNLYLLDLLHCYGYFCTVGTPPTMG